VQRLHHPGADERLARTRIGRSRLEGDGAREALAVPARRSAVVAQVLYFWISAALDVDLDVEVPRGGQELDADLRTLRQ
jgi:hypothetical protein